jgi:hypothetical protein
MQILRASVAYLTAFAAAKTNRSTDLRVVVAGAPAGGSLSGNLSDAGYQPVINAGSQTVTMPLTNAGASPAWFPAASITAHFGLTSGRHVATNSDCVCNATDDLAAELLTLGWAPFTPPGNYALSIPIN